MRLKNKITKDLGHIKNRHEERAKYTKKVEEEVEQNILNI